MTTAILSGGAVSVIALLILYIMYQAAKRRADMEKIRADSAEHARDEAVAVEQQTRERLERVIAGLRAEAESLTEQLRKEVANDPAKAGDLLAGILDGSGGGVLPLPADGGPGVPAPPKK